MFYGIVCVYSCDLYVWGKNHMAYLGLGRVLDLVNCVGCTDSGDLYVWGKNHTACLGLGHVLDQFFPYKVSTECLFVC